LETTLTENRFLGSVFVAESPARDGDIFLDVLFRVNLCFEHGRGGRSRGVRDGFAGGLSLLWSAQGLGAQFGSIRGRVVFHGGFAGIPPEPSGAREEIDRITVLRSTESCHFVLIREGGVDSISRVVLTGVVLMAAALKAAYRFNFLVLSTFVEVAIGVRKY
jgi:hypothetical protein